MVEAGQGAGDELVLARRAGRLDGGDDAAAGAGDLLVARAFQAQLELVRPVAAKDEMGVAIDEPGRDPAALAVDSLARIPAGGQVLCRSGKGDAAVLGSDGAVLDDPEAVMPASVARRALSQTRSKRMFLLRCSRDNVYT